MRKSREVPLTLLATVALASITACHDQARHCVDAQGHLMPDSECETRGGYGYHYVYGGSSGGHVGDMVVGSSVSRGGFGGHGGGGE